MAGTSDEADVVDIDADVRSQLMTIAYDGVRRSKRSAVFLPARALHHIPDADLLIKPIDTVKIFTLSRDISQSGYRDNEQVFSTPPFLSLGLPRYLLAGNHRSGACRNSGRVLLPSFILAEKVITKMMALLAEKLHQKRGQRSATQQDEDETKIPAAHMLEAKRALFFKCLSLVIVATQCREPSPKPPTVLQMVRMLRTLVRNDPDVERSSKKRGLYGGIQAVQGKLFGSSLLQENGDVHFLLDMRKGNRHMNKLLRGSYQLIETKLRGTVQALGRRDTLLDLLLYWEQHGLMPEFTISHLANVGSISADTAIEIAEESLSQIYINIADTTRDPALLAAPFQKCVITQGATCLREHRVDGEGDGTTSRVVSDAVGVGDGAGRGGDDAEPDDEQEEAAAGTSNENEEEEIENRNAGLRRSQRNKKRVMTYEEHGGTPAKRKKIGNTIKSEKLKSLKEALKVAKEREEKQKEENERLQKAVAAAEREAEKKTALQSDEQIRQLKERLEKEKSRELHEIEQLWKKTMKEEVAKERVLVTKPLTTQNVQCQRTEERVDRELQELREEKQQWEQAKNLKNGAIPHEKELLALRKEVEKLKKERSPSHGITTNEELQRLREENLKLKKTLENGSLDSQRGRGAGKRVVVLSSNKLQEYSSAQLESLVNRAKVIISSRK